MRLTVVAIVMSGLVASCAEAPTQPRTVTAESASLARDVGTGATIVKFGETGVDLNLPTGTCMFRPDGTGNFNNFLRTNTDGSVFLKLEDESGTITVIPTGGRPWVGTGRANVIWPNYNGSVATADWFEMTVVGTVSAGGETAHATCKYRIANGDAVEWFIKLN
jgi:hypothetical protein